MKTIILWATSLSLGLLLASCGGGGGTVDTRASYSLQLTADRTSLPVNAAGTRPNIGGPYTATLYLKAQDIGGTPIPGGDNVFACNIIGGLESGALYYLDGKEEHEKEEDLGGGVKLKVPIAYRSITLGANAGAASFHFHTGDKAGTATVRCTYTDPNGQIRSKEINLTVGGSPSSLPAQVSFYTLVPGYLFVQGHNQPTSTGVRLTVVDEAGRPVPLPSPGVNNVRVRLVPTSSADETASISGINAADQQVDGKQISLRTDAQGLAQFTVSSGILTGTLMLEATADRYDNNVDNGVSDPVYGYTALPVVIQVPQTTGLAIVTQSLPAVQRNIPYAFLLEASGGSPPYTWQRESNTRLPTGLQINASGVIHGTVTDPATQDGARPGVYNIVVEIKDRLNTTVRKSLSLTLGN